MQKELPLVIILVFLVAMFNNAFAQTELWGLTSGASSFFKVSENGTNFTSTIFGGDPLQGFAPQGSLVKASNSKHYGVASGGKVGLLGASSGYLGVIFEIDPIANLYVKKWDFSPSSGANPTGNLTVGPNGKLYGMTYQGGVNGGGVIYQFDQATGSYEKKYDFTSASGFHPLGNSLTLASNSKFYGMTNGGGTMGFGVIFEFDPINSTYKKLVDFDGIANGRFPHGDLIQTSNGKLYGVTFQGGSDDQGVLFEFDPSTFVFSKKIDFQNSVNGSFPFGSLVQATNKKLYGRTGLGGTFNNGVLFEFDYTTNTLTIKAEFKASTTGNEARGAMVESSNGKLYGMNSSGGVFNAGVLYEFDIGSGSLTKKYDFSSSSGGEPRGSLILYSKTIPKLEQAITFNPIGTIIFNVLPVLLTASATSNLPIHFTSLDPTIASIQGDKVTMLKSGTVTIKADQPGNDLYNQAPSVTQVLVIDKSEQTITFNLLEPKKEGDAIFSLTASSTSGLPITYINSNPDVALVSGNLVTILSKGSTSITATQSGNNVFLPALEVSQPFKVNEKQIDKTNIGISIYPNPTADSIKVRLSDKSINAQLTIFKINGGQKFEYEFFGSEFKLSVSDYHAGVYVVKITIGEYIETRRFVKL
jgi:uncharacterized repeat protein (TIGR03803 family)